MHSGRGIKSGRDVGSTHHLVIVSYFISLEKIRKRCTKSSAKPEKQVSFAGVCSQGLKHLGLALEINQHLYLFKIPLDSVMGGEEVLLLICYSVYKMLIEHDV